MKEHSAVIIGAGPAGLTAAHELLERTDIKPLIFEESRYIGGISKTVNYKGNRIDIGGHRFFSKSDWVMRFWLDVFPLQGPPAKDDLILDREPAFTDDQLAHQGEGTEAKLQAGPDPEKQDNVMLARQRVSRIFFLHKFFDYPLSLSCRTLANLGIWRTMRIGASYLRARLLPIKEEKSLEDFLVNRFGRELYSTFFRDYTQKVWGVPCEQIKPEWGAQRIKGLSISGAILHAVRNILHKDTSVSQRGTETTLINRFIYPKYGPGQLWEEVARLVESRGGKLSLKQEVTGLKCEGERIVEVQITDADTGEVRQVTADYVFSTMPVKDLIAAMGEAVPDDVQEVAQGLIYRDFVTVGLLLKKLKIKNETKIKTVNDIVPDNWIYIQEKDVKVGRLQVFNNWSPYMVKDDDTVWVGLEYFCDEGDELWSKPDDEFVEFAIDELAKIDMIDKSDVLDGTVIRSAKTYPAYFGSYDRFDVIRSFVDKFENLFLIGRNGMHKYNNQDHSMLTALTAVENIVNHVKTKDNIWAVNAEQEYHEEK
jgi:protoporphyrinogen oxidase